MYGVYLSKSVPETQAMRLTSNFLSISEQNLLRTMFLCSRLSSGGKRPRQPARSLHAAGTEDRSFETHQKLQLSGESWYRSTKRARLVAKLPVPAQKSRYEQATSSKACCLISLKIPRTYSSVAKTYPSVAKTYPSEAKTYSSLTKTYPSVGSSHNLPFISQKLLLSSQNLKLTIISVAKTYPQ